MEAARGVDDDCRVNHYPRMRVTYFDEVKANPQQGQKWYTVGGLSIPADEIPELEERVNEIADSVFGTRELTPDTEFHAAYIYSAKGRYKGMAVLDRINILVRLGEVIASSKGTKRVYAAIDTSKLYNPEQAPEMAFAHFCERVQLSLEKGTKTLLIGDQDDEHAKAMIAAFARYRSQGTPWQYGIEIGGILDAVHFARSHHSRMIQLADTYLFLLTHRWGSRKGWAAEKLSDGIKDLELWAHRYKEWPNG